MPETPPNLLTDHQKAWWGTQKCRRCNMEGLPARAGVLAGLVLCPDCDGSGYTVWAALATEPWTEIIPGLFIGGHDFNVGYNGSQVLRSGFPEDLFDTVVSMYRRPEPEEARAFEPWSGTTHHEVLFEDSRDFSLPIVRQATRAGLMVFADHRAGRRVLVRCQAGLNRSSLVAGIAMVAQGFSGSDVVQLIRARRSPWALCNEQYANFLASDAAMALTRERANLGK